MFIAGHWANQNKNSLLINFFYEFIAEKMRKYRLTNNTVVNSLPLFFFNKFSFPVFTEYAGRRTVTVADVIHALKRQGRALYGFGG